MRQRLAGLLQAAAFLPMIGAAGVAAWMAQSDRIALPGILGAALLMGAAWLLVELPYLLPSDRSWRKRKTPTCAGTQAGARCSSQKDHYKNQNDYNTDA